MITCKDERSFKFKIDSNGEMFSHYLKVIKKYSIHVK